MPKKKNAKKAPKHPQKKESDPLSQKEYRESDGDALDPHRKNEIRPL